MFSLKFFGFLAALSLSLTLSGQVTKHIPQDADFVLELNPGYLNQKYDLTNIAQTGLWNLAMGELRNALPPEKADLAVQFLESPSQFGINGLGKMYIIGRVKDADNAKFGMLFQLNDADKAVAFLDNMTDNTLKTMTERGGVQYKEIDGDAILAWNQDVAFLGGVEMNMPLEAVEETSYDFEDIDVEEEIMEDTGVSEESDTMEEEIVEEDATDDWNNRYEAFKKERNVNAKAWTFEVLKGFTANIAQNPQWQLAQQSKDDFSLFIDYQLVQKLNEENQQAMQGLDMMGMGDMMEALQNTYDDTFMELSLNFDQGAIRMSTDMFMNEALQNIYKQSAGGPFHNKMLKYINGENLIGFYHFNYDLEGITEGTKKYIENALGERPAIFDLIEDGTEMMGIKINQKTITEMITGDILVAINDIRMVETQVTEYDYDEDFNPIEKTVTKEVPTPIFTAVSHYDEDDELEDIFDLGVEMGFLVADESAFKLSVPDMQFDAWVSMQDNMLLLSNDPMLKSKKGLKRGYGKMSVPPANVLKMLNGNYQTLFVDFQRAIDAATASESMDMMTAMAVGMVSQQLESFVIRGPREGLKTAHADILLNMTNKDQNALQTLVEFSNMILGTMGMDGSRG